MLKDFQIFEKDNLLDKYFFINSINDYSEYKYTNIINIDTKEKYFNDKRIEITNQYKLNNDLIIKKLNINYKSSIKGDKLLISDKCSILDDKNYDKISGLMKFPDKFGISSEDYTKGIDSNIKYTFSILNINFYNDNSEKIYKELIDKCFDKSDYELLPINIKLGTISKDHFIHIISFNELGFGYELLNLNKDKYFICADKSKNIKYIKKIDFNNITSSDEIEVSLYIDEITLYIYLLFIDNNEVIYIVSQRKNFERANCSFIINKRFEFLENSIKNIR
jgi:hypothetical protein